MRRTLFLIGLLVELVAVLMIFLPNALLVATGTTVTLKTIPVDPRSIFRGDYVVLSYEIAQKYSGPGPKENTYASIPVYATLEKKDNVFVAKEFTTVKPVLAAGEACITGVARSEYRWISDNSNRMVNVVSFPDIEQFFVTEGFGRELEQATRSHKLFVDIATDASCGAVIKGVRIAEEAALLPAEGVPEEKIPPVEVR